MQELKARLKAAGVNGTVAGINAEDEDEEYDSEEEEDDGGLGSAKKVASAEKDESHIPKIAGTSMTEFQKAGIPKPTHNNLINPVD